MFFVLHIFLLIIYVSEANNLDRKRDSGDVISDVKQNDKRVIFQDVNGESLTASTHKPSLQNPNLTVTNSLNALDKQISEEVMSKKRHIQEQDFDYDKISLFKSSKLKNIKNVMSSPSLNFDPKWPIVKLLSETDNIEENHRYIDDFDSIHQPYFDDTENLSKAIKITKSDVNDDLYDVENNQSSYKSNLVTGLKSLSARALPMDARRQCNCMTHDNTPHKCSPPPNANMECTRTAVSFTMMPIYMPFQSYVFSFQTMMPSVIMTTTTTPTTTNAPRTINMPKGIPIGFPMGIPMGIPAAAPMGIPMGMPAGAPMGYPMGMPPPPPMGYQMGIPPPPPMGYQMGMPPPPPMGVPPGIPDFYNPSSVTKPKKTKKPHTDEEYYYDDEKWFYIYNDNRETDSEEKKQDKNRKDKIIINIDYEDKKDNKIKWNSIFRNERPEKFVKDIIADLDAQGDTLGKNCFCLSSSHSTKLSIYLIVLYGAVVYLF